jgi:hypothetical protein
MKGITIQQVPQILMICMLIGIFIGATYITLEAFQSSQYVSTAITNETINFAVNNTYYNFANPYLTSTSAVTQVMNTTLILTPENYTVTNDAYHHYQIKLIAKSPIAVGNYNVTYTYNKDTKASTGIGYVVSMMDNLSQNMPTVGIMIFVGILITVVFWMVASGKIGGKGKGGA